MSVFSRQALSFKAIQVKTRTTDNFTLGRLPKEYDVVALVRINRGAEPHTAALDESAIYLFTKEEIGKSKPTRFDKIDAEKYGISWDRIREIFGGWAERHWDNAPDNDRVENARVEVPEE